MHYHFVYYVHGISKVGGLEAGGGHGVEEAREAEAVVEVVAANTEGIHRLRLLEHERLEDVPIGLAGGSSHCYFGERERGRGGGRKH